MKPLSELQQELNEVRGGGIKVQYSSDSKLVPDGAGGYRKVRAHRIEVGKKPQDPDMAPEVGDSSMPDNSSSTSAYQKFVNDYNRKLKKDVKGKVDPIQEQATEQPPYILVLKRQNVRQFPGNMMVALYYNEKLNKHFSVPYGKGMDASIQAEETITELTEQELVSYFLNTFSRLTEENKQKMLDMINTDYDKIKEFTLNK